jgi:hypothetical protein
MKKKGLAAFAFAVLITIFALQSLALLPPAFSTPSVRYVAPTPTGSGSSGGSCSKPGYNTISAAITAASAGDTIYVCIGTYTEQLVISKSLTITGISGASTTIIQAPSPMAADSFGELNIVTITGASTTAKISGFTITGPVSVTCNTGIWGIGIFVQQGATATITRNIITKIHNNPIVQCALYGFGILVGRAALSTTGTATISVNTISDYQKAAIMVDGAGSTATITSNTITGWSLALQASDSVFIAQNGIQISRGAVATITSNTISVNECPAGSDGCGPDLIALTQATGIVLYQSGAGTSVTMNTFSANDVGIELYQADASTVVQYNRVANNRYAGIALEDGTYKASLNVVTGPGNVGIAAVADASSTSVTLSKNIINSVGISGVTASIGAYAGSGLTATILSS